MSTRLPICASRALSVGAGESVSKQKSGSSERYRGPKRSLLTLTRSHGVLASPLAGRGLILGAVSLVDVSDLGHERVIRVSVSQQGADGEEHLRDGERGRPLILQDVQANGTVRVDIGVVDSSCEVNLGRLEGVIGGEVDVEEVDTAGVGGFVGTHDGRLPVELILVVDGASRAVGGGILAKIDEFLCDSFESHNIVSN